MVTCMTCPAARLGLACHAREAEVERYCVLVALGRDDYRRLIVERSGGAWTPDPPAAEPPRAGPDLTLPRLVLRCPHRSRGAGCGCDGRAVCALGKGTDPGRPTWDDCLACVASRASLRPLVNAR